MRCSATVDRTASAMFCLLLACAALTLFASPALAERDPIRLTHGPMLGQPTAHSMAVWGRTSDDGEFTVHTASNPISSIR